MPQPTAPRPAGPDQRAVQILAKTLYRELRANGYDERQVMTLAGELLSQVSSEMRERRSTEGR